MNLKGQIKHVSKSKPGSMHDFALHKKEPPVSENTRIFVDSGYQGINKLHKKTEIPYKKKKGEKLTKEEKEYNTALSKIRVKVENVIRQIKIFKIIGNKYRNKRKRYGVKFNIVAGIVNIKQMAA